LSIKSSACAQTKQKLAYKDVDDYDHDYTKVDPRSTNKTNTLPSPQHAIINPVQLPVDLLGGLRVNLREGDFRLWLQSLDVLQSLAVRNEIVVTIIVPRGTEHTENKIHLFDIVVAREERFAAMQLRQDATNRPEKCRRKTIMYTTWKHFTSKNASTCE
jgi:hypothetical protein